MITDRERAALYELNRASARESAITDEETKHGERKYGRRKDHLPPFSDVREPAFGGDTYEPPRDSGRLRAQLGRVRDVMQDGQWRTLAELAEATGDPEASVSARLRDLRKAKFGAHIVEREFVSKGLWRYRMTANPIAG